jgi:hypothetical protein
MKLRQLFLIVLAVSFTGIAHSKPVAKLSDKEVVDAYQYLLSRLLVLRQENLDFSKEGFKWNEIIHRKVGEVQWANPNLDVAYSEAWIGIDNNSCTLIEVPKIENRYYTVQTLNGWGETTSNINERTFPKHPSGKFAYCLKDAKIALGSDVQRINLPSKKSRVLARVELGKDPKSAIDLQQQIKISPTGKPEIAEAVEIPMFENNKLPGIEAFDRAAQILASEKDINPGMGGLQTKVLAVQRAAKNPKTREVTDQQIHEKAIPSFMKLLSTNGTIKNGWLLPKRIGNYGGDYQSRTMVDYGGIWANNNNEVVYYKTNVDGTGKPLDGSNVYTMTFPKDAFPESMAKYFWSVIVVDATKFQVVPNTANKFLINNVSGVKPNPDGTLTFVFAYKKPAGVIDENWLPTPPGQNYHLTFRFYGPDKKLVKGKYFPPPLVKSNEHLAELRSAN